MSEVVVIRAATSPMAGVSPSGSIVKFISVIPDASQLPRICTTTTRSQIQSIGVERGLLHNGARVLCIPCVLP